MNSQANPVSVKRTLTGKVVSDKRSKTVTVSVERQIQHQLYGKFLQRTTKYHAHTETGDVKEGDTVEIQESRPLSKTKNWVVTKIVETSKLI